MTSTVQYVVLDGKLVYDRSKDVRMKHLMTGAEQINATPSGAEQNPHTHDDEDPERPADAKPKKDAGEKDQSDKPDHEPKKD